METAEVVVIILLSLTLIGALGYFLYTYIQDRNNMESQISATTAQVSAEQSNRLSNIKYVVDQLNGVTGDISNTITNSNVAFQSSLNATTQSIATSNALFNAQFSQFGSNLTSMQSSNLDYQSSNSAYLANSKNFINIGTAKMSLFDIPGAGVTPNINLMQNVIALSGLTGSNLTPANSFQFCYGPDMTNCIQFPDQNSNTFITAPTGGFIDLHSRTQLESDLNVLGNTYMTSNVYVCPPGQNTNIAQCAQITTNSTGVTISPPSGGVITFNSDVKVTGKVNTTQIA
jgi:hypothetical protein